jgi:CBS domain-containing protein
MGRPVLATQAEVSNPDPLEEDPMPATMSPLRVANLMTIDPVTIEADAPVREAEKLIRTYRVSGLPVVAGGVIVGVISQTDVVLARSIEIIGANWDKLRVRHLMTQPAITVQAGATLERAADLMLDRHIHRVVVVDENDTPIGVITTSDLLRAVLGDPNRT